MCPISADTLFMHEEPEDQPRSSTSQRTHQGRTSVVLWAVLVVAVVVYIVARVA